LFNHILNDILTFWIKNPKASKQDTLDFALKQYLIEKPSKAFFEFITAEHTKFTDRSIRKVDWIDKLPKENSPLGCNPFIDDLGILNV